MIEYFEEKLRWIILSEASVLLRYLGGFHQDRIILISDTGCCYTEPKHLIGTFSATEYAMNIHRIYFKGGPMQNKRYKGCYLTFLVDRCLLVACERDKKFVDCAIAYAKGFGVIDGCNSG